MIENPDVSPGERLLVLKEAADEARAYKMGGEDKIRVAVNTCDMVRSLSHPLFQPINAFLQLASHTEYIESLLRSLTSLPALAPYVQKVALSTSTYLTSLVSQIIASHLLDQAL